MIAPGVFRKCRRLMHIAAPARCSHAFALRVDLRRSQMGSDSTPRRWFRAVLSSLCLTAVSVPCVSQQAAGDAFQLQRNGIAAIDRWLEHVRRTGDATDVRNALASAQAMLETSDTLFEQRRDF